MVGAIEQSARVGKSGRLAFTLMAVCLLSGCGSYGSAAIAGRSGTSGDFTTPTSLEGPFPFGQNPFPPPGYAGTTTYSSFDATRAPIAAFVAAHHVKALVFNPRTLGNDFVYYLNPGGALAAVRADLTILEQPGFWTSTGFDANQLFTRADGSTYALYRVVGNEHLMFGKDGTVVDLVQPAPDSSGRPSPGRLAAMGDLLYRDQVVIGDPNAPFPGNQPTKK